MLADYMILLARRLPDLAPEEGTWLAKAVEAMVAACLGPSSDRLAVASKQLGLTLMERVRRSLRANLRSPSLGPQQLCREAAISRTRLYRLLEGEGGVTHYVRRQRLSAGFAQLSDISNVLPVFRIAKMLCFTDTLSFSRAFRREFGMSPSDVRAAALAGLPEPSWKSAENESIDRFTIAFAPNQHWVDSTKGQGAGRGWHCTSNALSRRPSHRSGSAGRCSCRR
jgi:AraC-like DNA-binding protein